MPERDAASREIRSPLEWDAPELNDGRRRLSLESRPIRLKQLLMRVESRQALVCMFLALLEMVRLQAIQVRQDKLFGEIAVRKHIGFDAVMAEQAAVRDDWR